jgi:hypothetical protein
MALSEWKCVGSGQWVLSVMLVLSCGCLGLAVAAGWDRLLLFMNELLCMNCCSYGRNRVVFCVGCSGTFKLDHPYF